MPYKPKPIAERFWSKVEKTDNCWLWTGSKLPRGYGRLGIGSETDKSRGVILAHRLSWILFNGEIPDGMMVLHNCPGGDNPSCVNPDHLWIGYARDNSSDMVQKGRQCRKNHVGVLHPRAKLTESQVKLIRQEFHNGNAVGDIAEQYNVSRGCISGIVYHKNWKHI